MKFYAGIGSRETPDAVLTMMFEIGVQLANEGWTLRSGGAEGADTAFEKGAETAGGEMEIYLPWAGFNKRESKHVVGDNPAMRKVAERFHPAWDRCSPGARALHSRNVAQVLGMPGEKKRSRMVICWTKDGGPTGGTGQAIRIAKGYEVEVFNLFHGRDALNKYLSL